MDTRNFYTAAMLLFVIASYQTQSRCQQTVSPEGSIIVNSSDPTELPEGDVLVENTDKWREALRSFAKREHTPVFFQVYLKSNLLNFGASQPLGVRAMEALERATSVPRVWKQIQGVQVFQGDMNNIPDIESEDRSIVAWLSTLSDDEIGRLTRDSLPLERVPLDIETALQHSIGWNKGDISMMLWDRRSDFSLRLRFFPYISAADKDKNNFIRLEPIDLPLVKPLTAPLPPVIELPFLPLEPVTRKAGEKVVDFGAGDILSWPQIIERANLAFGVTYQAPTAKDSTRFFVSGVIPQSAWEATLNFLQEVQPLPAVADEPERGATPEARDFVARALKSFPFLEKMRVDTVYLRGEKSHRIAQLRAQQNNTEVLNPRDILEEWNKLAGGEEFLPLADFAKGKGTTVAELIKKSPGAADIGLGMTGADGNIIPWAPIRPGLAAALELHGFEPSDKLRLRLSLSLEVSAPGKHPSSLGGSLVEGKFVPSMNDNRALISIN